MAKEGPRELILTIIYEGKHKGWIYGGETKFLKNDTRKRQSPFLSMERAREGSTRADGWSFCSPLTSMKGASTYTKDKEKKNKKNWALDDLVTSVNYTSMDSITRLLFRE